MIKIKEKNAIKILKNNKKIGYDEILLFYINKIRKMKKK